MKDFRYHSIPAYAEVVTLLGRPRSILDVGCSEGFFLGELQGTSLRVGVELNWDRLSIGKRHRPGIAFVQADAAALPFADGAFESVVSIGVLSYLADPDAAIAEAARVLKPSKRLIVTAATNRPVYAALATHLLRRGVRLLDRSRIASAMTAAGLVIAVSYEKGLIVAPLLNLLYTAASQVDRRLLRRDSVVGPLGRLARTLTHPLIRLEYRLGGRTGNTSFVAADKK